MEMLSQSRERNPDKSWSKQKTINPNNIDDSKVKPSLLIDLDPLKTDKDNIVRCPFCNTQIKEGDKTYIKNMAVGDSYMPYKGNFNLTVNKTKLVKYCWNCALVTFDTANFRLKVNPAMLVTKQLLEKGLSLKEISSLINVKYSIVKKWKFRLNQRKKKFLDTGRSEWEYEQEFPDFQDFIMLIDVLQNALDKTALRFNLKEKEKGDKK